MRKIVDLVQSQVISSIKNENDLEKTTHSDSNIVFHLTGNLMTTKQLLNYSKKGK